LFHVIKVKKTLNLPRKHRVYIGKTIAGKVKAIKKEAV